MPTGNFNVSRLLAQLGHKNVIEMPVSKNIQATLPVASMAGQVPVHPAGVTMAGGYQVATVGEYTVYEIQSLDPGGFVWQFSESKTATDVVLAVTPNKIAYLTAGPIVHPNVNFTSNFSLSRMTSGTTVLPGSTTTKPRFGANEFFNWNGFAPFLVPRGMNLQIHCVSANTALYLTCGWCGIAATENEE